MHDKSIMYWNVWVILFRENVAGSVREQLKRAREWCEGYENGNRY